MGNHPSVKQFGSSIRPNILLGLIWVQIVGEDYQWLILIKRLVDTYKL